MVLVHDLCGFPHVLPDACASGASGDRDVKMDKTVSKALVGGLGAFCRASTVLVVDLLGVAVPNQHHPRCALCA